MTLAQDTSVLLLDEPTTYLDLAHAIEVLELVDHLNRELHRTVVMVLHDLNLAARYSDRIIAMQDGAIKCIGTPEEIITQERLLDIFGLDATVLHDSEGTPIVVPLSGRRRAATRTA